MRNLRDTICFQEVDECIRSLRELYLSYKDAINRESCEVVRHCHLN